MSTRGLFCAATRPQRHHMSITPISSAGWNTSIFICGRLWSNSQNISHARRVCRHSRADGVIHEFASPLATRADSINPAATSDMSRKILATAPMGSLSKGQTNRTPLARAMFSPTKTPFLPTKPTTPGSRIYTRRPLFSGLGSRRGDGARRSREYPSCTGRHSWARAHWRRARNPRRSRRDWPRPKCHSPRQERSLA